MIAWFARNHVAANLLLVAIVFAGLYSILRLLPLEVFPEIDIDVVEISVVQRAATPEDIETGITNRIEEAIADITGIKRIESTSREQQASITAELHEGVDEQKVLNEIKTRVDALSTLPRTAERPVVELPERIHEVLSLVVSGDIDEKELSLIARRVRDDLVRLPGLTQADLEGIRPYEIAIEVPEATLRRYGLTLAEVTAAINAQSLDLSAGQVRGDSGEILLRAKAQAYVFEEYEQLIVKRFADGSVLRLGDIASISDGFEEDPITTSFNGKPAAVINVYRVGKESAISISDQVHRYLEENAATYPPTVTFDVWDDDSTIVRDRLNMLLGNAWQGALLVTILLALFMRPAIAFWVVAGIPVAFMGGFALMPLLGITINTISLFGFILVLGIVVDDAIITSENVYRHYERDPDGLTAAIRGTEEVATPVVFGVLTTVVAFLPLTQMTGFMASTGAQIGWVVITVMLFSLLESKLILPAHLKTLRPPRQPASGPLAALGRMQDRVSRSMDWFIDAVYAPALSAALHRRYLTVLVFVAVGVVTVALVMAGWAHYTAFPRVTSTEARANLEMPVGTPLVVTEGAIRRIEAAAFALRDKYRSPTTGESLVSNVISTIGAAGGGHGSGSSNRGRVRFETVVGGVEGVDITMPELVNEWRALIGTIPGAEELTFRAEVGPGSDPVEVQLSSNDIATLEEVTAKVREHLAQYAGVFDIRDTLSDGKRELRIQLKPQAELLGLDLQAVTEQVRSAFYGEQAQRIQRGRDDIRVMVRYPLAERSNVNDLDELLIKTPAGAEARFADIATVHWDRSPSDIDHVDRQRTVSIRADIDKDSVNQAVLFRDIDNYVTGLLANYPTVGFRLEGEAQEQREAMTVILWGTVGVLFGIYALLAIPFASYSQPLIVMSIIPFAVVAAVLGHWIMGREISMLSITGMLALVGVAVNDSLVMVDWINRKVQAGEPLFAAVATAGRARFRPIILTSLTTFLGLFPLLFETSVGAQFVIPMAISLGFGILLTTFVTLLLIPCNYLILDDLSRLRQRLGRRATEALPAAPAAD